MKISPAQSAYLDFLRFVAALAVLLGHMKQNGFDMAWMPLARFTHEAVVVFFVMSGFIVYTSTAARRGDFRAYVAARASRIYSVALPAVVFSVGLALTIGLVAPSLKTSIASWREFSLADIVASLLFLNQSWSMTTDVPLNGPYWSLCYEVWYYIAFGVYFFAGSRIRWPLLALVGAVCGPAIVALFPLWCVGAWLAARRNRLPPLGQSTAWLIFIGGPLLILVINQTDLARIVAGYYFERVPGFWRLAVAQGFLTDYLIGLAIVAHLHAFSALPAGFCRAFERSRVRLAQLAGFSFTLYLFHRPILELVSALLPAAWHSALAAAVIAPAILGACWLISFVTERRLPQWRAALNWLLRRPACASSAPPAIDSALR